MPAPENRLKAALARGEMQLGTWLDCNSPVVAEIAAGAGFDWCLIDAEHAPFDMGAMQAQVRAMAASGVPVAARVPVGEAWVIKQVLDLGVQSILVPMVDSAEQARAMVAAMRYPPAGTRGLAPPIVRASRFGAVSDYQQTANAQTCLMVQAESRRALDDIDAIAGVEGVDCVFIGPHDLAADMGFPGDLAAPEVVRAIDHITDRTRAAGKAIGIFCLDPGQLRRYAARGVTMIAVASDVVTLSRALREQVATARAAVAKP